MTTGWATTTIGEACSVFSGGTPSKGNDSYWRGDIPWVSAKDLKFDQICDAELHISAEACAESAAKMAPAGSLLVLVRGMGLANGVPIGEVTSPVAFNQDIRAIVPSKGLRSRFLLLALRHAFSNSPELLSSAAHGTLKIDAEALRTVSFPVPSWTEQQRIVAILDEAFEGIATAKANAEKNLQNAREIFDGYLANLFADESPDWIHTTLGASTRFIDYRGKTPNKTSSGLRLITAKNVKMGFLQKNPQEFVSPGSYDGWMTRGLPRCGDVLFTTEAPLANVAQLDVDEKVVFAQRIIVMQPDSNMLNSTLLKYLLLSDTIQRRIHSKGTGATVKGIKASLLRTIEISFPASLDKQVLLVNALDALRERTLSLAASYEKKLAALDELKKSLLHQAFTGQLTSSKQTSIALQAALQTTSPEFAANVICLAYARHEQQRRERSFGRVKEQKLLHLAEAIAKINMGRHPIKDAAGPNDFQHMLKAEEWAKAHNIFEMVKRDGGYDFKKLGAFDAHMSRAQKALAPYLPQLERVIDLLVPMDTEEAEVFATVHAA